MKKSIFFLIALTSCLNLVGCNDATSTKKDCNKTECDCADQCGCSDKCACKPKNLSQ